MDQIAIERAAPPTVRAGVNEKHLFKTMRHLFSTSATVLAELMQNARRAGASCVHFMVDEKQRRIDVADDGCGLSDFANLVRLCESGWDEETTLSDSPFGMGFFSVFFACEQVVIRSGGKRMSVSLDDIQNKRAIPVEADPCAIAVGTKIEMHGVVAQLLKPAYVGVGKNNVPTQLTCLAGERLVYYSKGFPIPVFVNGIELARPFALGESAAELTSIGHVHLAGVHDTQEFVDHTDIAMFLQGLPIATGGLGLNCRSWIHLDSNSFTARVPDRTALYDHDVQMKRIRDEVRAVGYRHLLERKAALAPREFVTRYFQSLRAYGGLALLNDMPFLPLAQFDRVSSVNYDPESVWYGASYSPADVLSRQDVISGAVKVWRDAPGSADADPGAATLLKVMQRLEVLSLREKLDAGHWLKDLAPSCEDLVVRLTPVNPKREAQYDWNANCKVVLVDHVDIKVTSRVGDASWQHRLENDWILESVDPEASAGIEDREMVCFVTAGDDSRDRAVDAFSDYKDEGDNYRDEWMDNARSSWDSLVSGLRGSSLASVLRGSSDCMVVSFSPEHDAQLALAQVEAGRLVFEDLSSIQFWEAMSSALPSPGVTAADLQGAFYRAAKADLARRRTAASPSLG